MALTGAKEFAKRVPGVASVYRTMMRARRRVLRAVCGPTQAERYDLETAEVVRRVLTPGSVGVDIGAHNGEILRMFREASPDVSHQAVEALPAYADRLKKRFPRDVIHACAVSNENGETEFNFNRDDPAYSGLEPRTRAGRSPNHERIPVAVRRIDDLVPGDAPVRLVKLDIEGAEYPALRGAAELIRRCRPVLIFEFGEAAALPYGATAEKMQQLIEGDFGMTLTTMRRWLGGDPPFADGEFLENCRAKTDFYFLADPGQG